MTAGFEKQLEGVIKEYESARARSKYGDASDVISNVQVRDLQTRCLAAIERIGGRNSVYYERATAILEVKDHPWSHLAAQVGVAMSLLSDLRNDYLKSLEEIIHSDVFSDFLEMADHLLESGYKDAAAVIAGSTLEAHLRLLCGKHGVATSSAGKPKKADTMNADLVKTRAYPKLDHKNVTAWLGLRNEAAHGNYASYDKDQVKLLIGGIRYFMSRNPA